MKHAVVRIKTKAVALLLAAATVFTSVGVTDLACPQEVQAITTAAELKENERIVTKADNATAKWIYKNLNYDNTLVLIIQNQDSTDDVYEIMEKLEKKVKKLNPEGVTFSHNFEEDMADYYGIGVDEVHAVLDYRERAITKADDDTLEWICRRYASGDWCNLYVRNAASKAQVKKIVKSLQKKLAATNPYGVTFTYKIGTYHKKGTHVELEDTYYRFVCRILFTYDDFSSYEEAVNSGELSKELVQALKDNAFVSIVVKKGEDEKLFKRKILTMVGQIMQETGSDTPCGFSVDPITKTGYYVIVIN